MRAFTYLYAVLGLAIGYLLLDALYFHILSLEEGSTFPDNTLAKVLTSIGGLIYIFVLVRVGSSFFDWLHRKFLK